MMKKFGKILAIIMIAVLGIGASFTALKFAPKTQVSGSIVDNNEVIGVNEQIVEDNIKTCSTWQAVEFSGLDDVEFNAAYVWICNGRVFYSRNTDQYELNKEIKTWQPIQWNGFDVIQGHCVWVCDGVAYFSYSSYQYKLNLETMTWETMTWGGLTAFSGSETRCFGGNYYCRNYKLNLETMTWERFDIGGDSFYSAIDLWTDGVDVYYSAGTARSGAIQYVFSVDLKSMTSMKWVGYNPENNMYIWGYGKTRYYSNGDIQYKLDVETHGWSLMVWAGLTEFSAGDVWTDGVDVYCSITNNHYILTADMA